MKKLKDFLRRIFITTCMLTGTTELAAHRLGTRFFLPELFVWRYSSMGGLDPAHFAGQMDGVRSFTDKTWCGYWNDVAEKELNAAEKTMPGFARLVANEASPSPHANNDPELTALQNTLAPLGTTIAELLTKDTPTSSESAGTNKTYSPQMLQAITALRHLVRAITYYQVSAFPGDTPGRMKAYDLSRRLFHQLATIIGPVLGVTIVRLRIPVDGDVVDGYLIFPKGTGDCPLVIVSNGLEGTVQELAIPLSKYHDSGMAVFVMEMPGSYAYKQPMSVSSEKIYHQVIDSLSIYSRVDSHRIGFVGVSFGGYWAARMALSSQRLRCAIACGAPIRRTFQGKGAVGTPEIIIRVLLKVTGAKGFRDLVQRLGALSLDDSYRRIKIPLLVINGDNDTLLGTEDSIDLAAGAPQGLLKLHENDDHCAMKHYSQWLSFSRDWLRQQLIETGSQA